MRYKPQAMLTGGEAGILRLIHHNKQEDDLSDLLGLPKKDVQRMIKCLVELRILRSKRGSLEPNGFFLENNESEEIVHQAKYLGNKLAVYIEDRWPLLQYLCTFLRNRPGFTVETAAYIIVGLYVLDLGALAAFYANSTLLPPPPRQATGEFYLWIIEDGELNRPFYGYSGLETGFYTLGNFGRRRPEERVTLIDQLTNMRLSRREKLKYVLNHLNTYRKLCLDLPHAGQAKIFRSLQRHGFLDEAENPLIPFLTQKDVQVIRTGTLPVAETILKIFSERKSFLEESFLLSYASRYASFAEYFCWLYHYCFSEALDILVQKGFLVQPANEYISWLEV
jgi:hypothetical protein